MTNVQKNAISLEEPQATELSEVTFHLAPRSDALPFRWVAGITAEDDSWQSGHEPNPTQELERLTVGLTEQMSRNLLEFARRHVGPNATHQEIEYWCHTFAHKVGATALRVVPSTVGGGEQGLADAQARMLFSEGNIIEPSELVTGEHAVVGDAAVNSSRRAPYHSMVGIGRPKGDDTGPNLAVQVDVKNGDLYVGDPADYLKDVQESGAHLKTPPQPKLYVQRTRMTVSGKRPVQGHKDDA